MRSNISVQLIKEQGKLGLDGLLRSCGFVSMCKIK